MGNGGAERAGSRLFFVDMYPLVIVGGVGKHIDLALSHGRPVADRHILTDTGFDLFKGLELFFHVENLHNQRYEEHHHVWYRISIHEQTSRANDGYIFYRYY